MFEYRFMVNAFLAGGIVAVVAATTGFFLVLRGQTFAGHALAHVGFTGATGAALLGLPPFWGLVALTAAGGAGMGLLGEKLSGRDVAIGMVLSIALGLGLLFLHFFTAFATQATALLFGNILGVSAGTLASLAILGAISLSVLALIARPLLFASLNPEVAEARGVPVRALAVAFLVVVAIAVAESVQIVGVLLVFTLMVGPAASAQQLTRRVGRGIAVAVLLALAETWAGLVLAYHTDWPTSFWITALSGGAYLMCLAMRRAIDRKTPKESPDVH